MTDPARGPGDREHRFRAAGHHTGNAGQCAGRAEVGDPADEDLVFKLVRLCASATGKPLTDDELRLIAAYPHQLALLYPAN